MNIRATLALNDNNSSLTKDFKFNVLNLSQIQLQPQVFSLPPLYKHLITRAEELAQIDANGNLGNPVVMNFSAVDAGLFLMRFLEDLEKFLNNAPATPSEKIIELNETIAKIQEAKTKLISKIAAGIDTVTDTANSAGASAFTAAIEAVKQYADTNIQGLYHKNILVQFEASQPGSNHAYQYPNFLVSIDQPEVQMSVKGTFTLQDQTTGYQPATAISKDIFLQPSAFSYQIEIPVPLKALPEPPALANREAAQTSVDGTQDVKKLTLWNYNLDFAIPQAAQDQVIIEVQFNSVKPDDKIVNTSAASKGLFYALAQYAIVADSLWEILEETAGSSYINAVKTFAFLTENIANYWPVKSPEPSAVVVHANETIANQYQYITRSNYENGKLISIMVSGVGNHDGSITGWPVLSLKDISGSFVPLESEKLTDNSVLYLIPEEVNLPMVIQWLWQGLHFEKVSVASAQLKVIRNQELIGGIATNPAFVLTSAVVNVEQVSPTFLFDTPINITKTDSSFSTELHAFFEELFATISDNIIASMEITYLQPVIIDDVINKDLVTRYPVAIIPKSNVTGAIAVEVVNTAEKWLADKPDAQTNGAEWAIELMVYDNSAPDLILLTIRQLVYQVNN